MPKKKVNAVSLTKDVATIKLAMEEIKRILDSNMEFDDKVYNIENVIGKLYQ